MFKEAYKQIKESYEGNIVIYPPVLYADDSLGEWPNISFFIIEENGTDMVIVNSQTGEVIGVTSVQGIELNKQISSCDIESIDEEITSICISMIRDNHVVKEAYTKYLKQNFSDAEEMILVAALCPNAISNDILKKLGNTPRLAQNALAELGRKIVFMEKNVPEVLKDIPAWFDNVPTARAYKNAVIAGNGDRLFRVIKMVGNQEAYNKCISDFAHFLFRMNMVEDKKISTTSSGYIHSNVGQVVDNPGNYWFFDEEHNPAPGNKMVVFNIADVKVEDEAIKRLIDKIGLTVEYSTMSVLLEDYPGWESIDEDEFVNNTILSHYGSNQDDILKASDLEWISDALIGNDANSVIKTAGKEISKEKVKEVKSQVFKHPVEVQSDNTKIEDKVTEPVVDVKAATLTKMLNDTDNEEGSKKTPPIEEKDKIGIHDVEQGEETAVNTDADTETDDLPSPEEGEDKPEEEETIESAQAKIAFNKELNTKMYEIYEQTATRLKAERDVRWRDFISEYRKAMEEENYTVRTCPRFLNMTSRDVKSPIYKILYETDKATIQYEKDLQRIQRNTMCFACHKPFGADITFAKYKEHTVKCPNCGNLIRTTIDWLK